MRFWLPLLAASVLALLNACGSSNSSSNGTIRLVNATTTGTYDFYNGTTLLSSGVVPGGASGYSSLAAAAYPFYVNTAGTATAVNGTTRSIVSGVPTSLIVYNTGGVTASALITDNQAAPSAGAAAFRIFNSSNEAGAVDVYVTAATVDLAAVSPTALNVLSGRLSAYGEIAAGTYRVRVTATGDKSDIRLDLPSVTLVNQEVATLVLTTASGGTLVNAVNVDQQGATKNYVNPSVRLRLVADAAAGGTVAATINGVSLGSLASPSIAGSYVLVPAGALTSTLSINGTTVAAPAGLSGTAGSDLSLLVAGTAAAPSVALLADDNSVPAVTTATKLRLVNGVNGLATPLTLTADFSVVASNVAFGTASTAVTNIAGSTSSFDLRQLAVTSSASAAAIYSASVQLSAGHVYTLFMLGDSTAPIAALRRDR